MPFFRRMPLAPFFNCSSHEELQKSLQEYPILQPGIALLLGRFTARVDVWYHREHPTTTRSWRAVATQNQGVFGVEQAFPSKA